MKFQFRSNPPNGDIVLNRAGSGYEAPDRESAWKVLATEFGTPKAEAAHLRTRYVLEPLGTEPKGAF